MRHMAGHSARLCFHVRPLGIVAAPNKPEHLRSTLVLADRVIGHMLAVRSLARCLLPPFPVVDCISKSILSPLFQAVVE